MKVCGFLLVCVRHPSLAGYNWSLGQSAGAGGSVCGVLGGDAHGESGADCWRQCMCHVLHWAGNTMATII